MAGDGTKAAELVAVVTTPQTSQNLIDFEKGFWQS